MIVETLDCDRRTDPFGEDLGHVDNSLTLADQCLDVITDRHCSRRLGWLAVHPHMATSAGIGCVRPRFGESYCEEPLIDADGVDLRILAWAERSALDG